MSKFTKVKKILMSILVLGQIGVVSNIANAAPTTSKNSTKVKKYDSLKVAAEDYAKALQQISRELSKSVNPEIEKYVIATNNATLKKRWEDINLLQELEISVYQVKENGNNAEAVYMIKGYDEDALNKYLQDNVSKYVTKVNNSKDEVEVDIEAYINLYYEYLQKTPKVAFDKSPIIEFKKDSNNKWQVVEK